MPNADRLDPEPPGGAVALSVVGPAGGTATLQAPADSTVRQLVAAVVERLAEAPSPTWRLVRPDGAALDPGLTLAEAGVTWGAELRLVGEAAAPEVAAVAPPPVAAGADAVVANASTAAPPSAAPAAAAPAGPSERTAALLPDEASFGHRFGAMMRAVFSPEPAPSAQTLAVPQRRSARARARQAWTDTDYLVRLERAVQAIDLVDGVTIAVLSPKGGVGKTTVTALLGTMLAMVRPERVVALDANPDYGSLGRVLVSDHDTYVDDFLALRERLQTVTALDAHLGRGPHKLLVLPAPPDPERMKKLTADDYDELIRELRTIMGIVLVDCGTGLQDGITTAAIGAADQLVLVTDADPASADLVTRAAPALLASGKPVTLVVNKVPARGNRLNVDALAAAIPDARGLVRIPIEPVAAGALATGEFSWTEAPPSWQRAMRELAVVVSAQWTDAGGAAAGDLDGIGPS